MAINPNTTFTAGQILTADQQNRLPRGLLALGKSAGTLVTFGTTAANLCSATFTLATSRQIQFIGSIPLIDLPSTNQRINAILFDGATTVANQFGLAVTSVDATNVVLTRVFELAAGTYTYTLRAATSTGTNRMNDGAAGEVTRATLQVIDLGAA